MDTSINDSYNWCQQNDSKKNFGEICVNSAFSYRFVVVVRKHVNHLGKC